MFALHRNSHMLAVQSIGFNLKHRFARVLAAALMMVASGQYCCAVRHICDKHRSAMMASLGHCMHHQCRRRGGCVRASRDAPGLNCGCVCSRSSTTIS